MEQCRCDFVADLGCGKSNLAARTDRTRELSRGRRHRGWRTLRRYSDLPSWVQVMIVSPTSILTIHDNLSSFFNSLHAP